MIFCSNEDRKRKLIDKLSQVVFFTISGGFLGAAFGGGYGLIKGISLPRILPRTIFKSSAFFASISAIQGTLEIGRNQKDYLNPLIAGGWTGFIFGHGLTKRFGYGVALGLNTALFTWALQSFTLPDFDKTADTLNPLLLEEKTRPLQDRIKNLQEEIESLQKIRSSK